MSSFCIFRLFWGKFAGFYATQDRFRSFIYLKLIFKQPPFQYTKILIAATTQLSTMSAQWETLLCTAIFTRISLIRAIGRVCS